LYTYNKDLIHSCENIYIATDNKNTLDFYKSKISNFTTFPSEKYHNLHYSNINSRAKITDLLSDIFIIAMSDILIFNYVGLFVELVRHCHNNEI